ncbi:MAG: LysR family transcriptional regulator [Actinomycetota bacterium]
MLSARVPDLASLELLEAVAATGSLGRAGAARGISQPAANTHVRRMEQVVGFPLVERGPRGSTLTPAGTLLVEWGRDVLNAAAVLDAGIASLRAGRAARLRVAASLTVAEHLMPRWLVRLAAEHPESAVSLDAVNSTEVARQVGSGDADLGFVEGPGTPPGTHGRVVARDRLQVVVSPAHPWSRRRTPLGAAELARTRLVQREPTSGTRAALEAALFDHQPLAAPLLELSSTSAVRAAVLADAGPAVLSSFVVRDDLLAKRLVAVPVLDVDFTRALRAIWPSGQRPTGLARDLLTICAAVGTGA